MRCPDARTPLAFLTETLPALYTRAVALLRAKADAGDARAEAALDDVAAARCERAHATARLPRAP